MQVLINLPNCSEPFSVTREVWHRERVSTILISNAMEKEDSSQLVEMIAISEVIDIHPPEIRMPISLDLPRWTAFDNTPAAPNDVSDVITVVEYFNQVATANSMEGTASVRKLRQALRILKHMTPQTNPEEIMSCDSLAFEKDIDVIPALNRSIDSLRALTLIPIGSQEHVTRTAVEQSQKQLLSVATMSVPIFNIWDSISLIYTLCVERILNDLMAELHLFQFRTIIQILSKHWYAGSYRLSPSTVAATWSDTNNSTSVRIAFATTCIGESREKRAMQDARYQFAKSLLTGLQVLKKTTGTLCMFYRPGNCPEWLTFILLWGHAGQYSSICQNKSRDEIFKLCAYCKELAQYFDIMGIHVNDIWDRSQLGVGKAVEIAPRTGFSYRRLMDYTQIKKEFGHVVGVCRGSNSNIPV